MAAPAACPICDGQLSLLHAGTARELAARSLSPTNHRTGEHGDLYRCRECGTVHQPSLPRGPELADLYRAMHDDAYLEEEPGRRRTAQRLLDMIGRFSPAGRLLDVGCGHGLLLDVARARGYEVEGLELSAASAAYAREVLGLTVHERTLDEHEPEEGYAAILLADVLEHLDDPVGAIRRCHDLLRPGGVVCVVTPDPGSLTARLAGSRWWALLPAHTFLIPRRAAASARCTPCSPPTRRRARFRRWRRRCRARRWTAPCSWTTRARTRPPRWRSSTAST